MERWIGAGGVCLWSQNARMSRFCVHFLCCFVLSSFLSTLQSLFHFCASLLSSLSSFLQSVEKFNAAQSRVSETLRHIQASIDGLSQPQPAPSGMRASLFFLKGGEI